MPRILPRILKRLDEIHFSSQPHKLNLTKLTPIKQRKSLWKPTPSFSLSPHGRTQSILLEDVNPVNDRRVFRPHKMMPPRLRVRRPEKRNATATEVRIEDTPRRMTPEERGWWSNPYLRMLHEPMRRCLVTLRLLPKDFLIRLAPFKMADIRGAPPSVGLFPDGLEHPWFQRRRNGCGTYILCRKVIMAEFGKGAYKRIARSITLHKLIEKQIDHLLRLRVLQELHVLGERLRIRERNAEKRPVLRRLTREEWKEIRATGAIPYKNAVAVLVVPPLNKDPNTKKRPEPSFSSNPIVEEPLVSKRPLPPVSVLHPTSPELENGDAESFLPNARLPLYNGLTLFPSRAQRAALHAALNKVISLERRTICREAGRTWTSEKDNAVDKSNTQKTDKSNTRKTDKSNTRKTDKSNTQKTDKRAQNEKKSSHAYLLCSDAKSLQRADSVPLAIALWRIRMWEGAGWGAQNGWILNRPKTADL
ncbi:hypothetical protein PHLCEN_2v12307 [Hermanssonia centrifuga]|uniref:Uncharacterized protein n=1 Tax=Hermanssonia centrifuga TaxID=98765 RepID=A0A2R6NHD9_9APHY|nr:hypothetical protein PHLCEN_2v12307 [Hermanssonia centrifuga]